MSGRLNITLSNPSRAISISSQKKVLEIVKRWPFKNFMVAEMSHLLPYRGRVPVIDFKNKRILFYSPKAGCSTAIKWFLRGAGLLEEAMAYDPEWIHNYISKVYRAKYDINRQLPRVLNNPHYCKIKVVRNPYARFASSFYHAIRWRDHFFPDGLADDFNMNQFLVLLKKQDRRLLNPHFASQYSLWEDMYPGLLDEVLHLENLDAEIKAMNERYGWTNLLDKRVTVLRHAAPREKMEDKDLHLTPYTKLLEHFPKDYGLFFTDEAFKQEVRMFYRSDFEHYGYKKDAV